MTETNKILGYLLLLVGIAIIIWSIYASYNIFTAKTSPPDIFKAEEKISSDVLQKNRAQDPEAMLEEALSKQLESILPINSLPTLLNLISWSIFASILIFAGSKISSIGVQLTKK